MRLGLGPSQSQEHSMRLGLGPSQSQEHSMRLRLGPSQSQGRPVHPAVAPLRKDDFRDVHFFCGRVRATVGLRVRFRIRIRIGYMCRVGVRAWDGVRARVDICHKHPALGPRLALPPSILHAASTRLSLGHPHLPLTLTPTLTLASDTGGQSQPQSGPQDSQVKVRARVWAGS